MFLSLELAAINPRTNPAIEAFPLKDLMDVDMNEFQNLLQMILVNADLNPTKPEAATCCNDEMPVSDLLTKIEADEESKGKFSDFNGLDGDRIKHGKYSFPHSLVPTLETIIGAYGDISATSKMNPSITEMVYIMFCASVKEMNDLRLEEITEDRILKWRDAIKDALRISFKVDFAMEHLKKIAYAYIGQIERQKLKDLAMRISRLEDDLNFRKQELAKAYKQSKVYIDVADNFNGKLVSWGYTISPAIILSSSVQLRNWKNIRPRSTCYDSQGKKRLSFCHLHFQAQHLRNITGNNFSSCSYYHSFQTSSRGQR
ncbi:hypothetical protein V6Z12_A01G057400 [Gossypium hirsutum]